MKTQVDKKGNLLFNSIIPRKVNRHSLSKNYYMLNPEAKFKFPQKKHNIELKRYKTKVKGKIDDYPIESINWEVSIPEKFNNIAINNLYEMPYMRLQESNGYFKDNYKLHINVIDSNKVSALLRMDKFPQKISEKNKSSYFEALCDNLNEKPGIQAFRSRSEEEHQLYMSFNIKAKTLAEVCKVAELLIDEIEAEASKNIN